MAYLPPARRALDVLSPVVVYRQIGRRPSGVFVDEAMKVTKSKGAAHRLNDRVYWKTQAQAGDQIQDRPGGTLLITAAGQCHPILLSEPRPLDPDTAFSHAEMADPGRSRRGRGPRSPRGSSPRRRRAGPRRRRRGRPTPCSRPTTRSSSTSCRGCVAHPRAARLGRPPMDAPGRALALTGLALRIVVGPPRRADNPRARTNARKRAMKLRPFALSLAALLLASAPILADDPHAGHAGQRAKAAASAPSLRQLLRARRCRRTSSARVAMLHSFWYQRGGEDLPRRRSPRTRRCAIADLGHRRRS